MITKHRKIRITFFIGVILIFLFLFFFFNPQHSIFFPKCPFYLLTGLQCPGCGSQRAIHSLLNLDIVQAFHYNALFVISIPYIAIGVYLEYFNGKVKLPKLRKILFGENACYIILIITISFFIIRNFLL